MKRIVLLCFCAGLLLAACGETGTVSVTHLRCENLIDPQGLDSHAPRLGWEIVANCRNVRQTGYRVLVSSSLEKLNANEGDLWDSGEVKSDESVFVAYAGSALESRAECYWKAKVTTTGGKSGTVTFVRLAGSVDWLGEICAGRCVAGQFAAGGALSEKRV